MFPSTTFQGNVFSVGNRVRLLLEVCILFGIEWYIFVSVLGKMGQNYGFESMSDDYFKKQNQWQTDRTIHEVN